MAALAAQTAVAVTEQGVPTLVAFVKHDLELSAAGAGAIAGAIPAGRVLGSYAAGRAVDALGERFVLVVGAASTGGLLVLAALAPLAAAVALLIAVGMFASTPTPAGSKLVLMRFPTDRRGLAMGIRQTGVPVGGLIAALTLPWLASGWGWRAALVAAGVITMAGAALAMVFSGVETPAERRAVGAARRRAAPRDHRIHGDRDVLLITTWGTLLVAGHYVILAFLPVYLFESDRLSLASAAAFVGIVQIGAIVGRLLWGVVSDRLFGGRRRPPMLMITVTGTASVLMLGLLPVSAPLMVFGVAAFLAGLSVVGWQGIWVVIVAELAGSGRAGTITGFSLTYISISIAVAPVLYGILVAATGDFRTVWLMLAGAVAVALVPCFALREPADRVPHG